MPTKTRCRDKHGDVRVSEIRWRYCLESFYWKQKELKLKQENGIHFQNYRWACQSERQNLGYLCLSASETWEPVFEMKWL